MSDAVLFPVGRITCEGCCLATLVGCREMRPPILFFKFVVIFRQSVYLEGENFLFSEGNLVIRDELLCRDGVPVLIIVPATLPSGSRLVIAKVKKWDIGGRWVGPEAAQKALEVVLKGA